MTTATWDPNSSNSNNSISASDKKTFKNHLIQLNDQLKSLDKNDILDFAKDLNSDNMNILIDMSNTLNFSKKTWIELTFELDTNAFKQLIFLFTAGENFHAELASGENSPAIKLYAAMKKTKHKLDKEELTWIRSNSSNKFIPNGSIL